MKKLLSCLVSLMMLLSFSGCASKTEEDTAALKDGTYSSSVSGMNDKINVTLTLANGKIEKVTVDSHNETPGIGGELKDSEGNVLKSGGLAPVEKIPADIVKYQSVEVDDVTGATITSRAIKNAVKDCLNQAGANIDDFSKAVEHNETFSDLTGDVVVVGVGGAGLAAAISAAQQGKSVIVIEKNGEIGGDTLVCGAIYNTPDEDLQKEVAMSDAVKTTIEKALAEEPVSEEHKALQAEVQKQWDEYKAEGRTDLFDSKEWYALQTWINGDKVANLDLVKTLCYNAYDGLEWIEDMGMEFSDKIGQGAGSLWQRTHTSTMAMGTGFMSVYAKMLDKYADKITLLTETSAVKLVKEGDKVNTVTVSDNHSGKTYNVKANDGVIMATGGFAANPSMVQENNTSGKWNDLSKVATTNRYSCSQGDGIKMATEVGASLTDMDQIQLLYLGNTKDGQLTKYPPRDVNGTDQIIFINKNGERFVREDGRRDEICLGVLAQPDSMFYMLESGDGAGYKDINDPDWRSADGFTFDYLKDNGYILVGDTLDDIAEQIGCDADTLKATVAAFNESVDTGEDKFGRTLYSTKLENGPWIATARQACVHHTMGGLTIDTLGHVLDESGNVIPGLYAAGEITGGIHGANRLGGNAVVDTVVFGKLASDTLVSDSTK